MAPVGTIEPGGAANTNTSRENIADPRRTDPATMPGKPVVVTQKAKNLLMSDAAKSEG